MKTFILSILSVAITSSASAFESGQLIIKIDESGEKEYQQYLSPKNGGSCEFSNANSVRIPTDDEWVELMNGTEALNNTTPSGTASTQPNQ